MKHFQVIISVKAQNDIAVLKQYIKDELKAPKTAADYITGLKTIVDKLSYLGNSICTNEYVQSMFGANARHIIYKKIAIIFYCEDDCVYIEQIIAALMIH